MLTDAEIVFIEKGKECGLFLPAERKGNSVFVSCGDGQRFRDIFLHMLTYLDLVHPVVLNGGPLLMADNAEDPLRQGDVMLFNIKKGIVERGFTSIVLASHWPCAIARDKKLSISDVLEKTVIAARMVREYLGPGYDVFPKLHVDYGVMSRPSRYWFSRKNLFLGIVNGQVLRRMCERKRSYIINEKHIQQGGAL
ncbi:hypothetical protein HY250_00015 [Candidatus Azambacteria bacterium]|nr:hypothetical protein [Candidatus Azambacteria bacterium]MBI3684784.1 hypothetical protein [Candidatus Azambacteria bacterium]